MGKDSAPGPQEKRFAAYMDGLAQAAGHADRAMPLKMYCAGLLLPGERKSVEPMAARLAPDNVRRMHQSLHHVVADAPWSDEAVLAQVRSYALTAMRQKGPVQAWIVDDTGFPKKGTHSVGVVRQYCGQVGKQENCRVAVSLSVSTNQASLPIAWRLYLPHEWADDQARRKQAGVPEEIQFETKPAIALQQIRTAVEQGVPQAPVLADAGYGTDTQFREAIGELGLRYVVGIMSSVSVWKPGEAPLSKAEWKGTGRPTKLLRRDSGHQADCRQRTGAQSAGFGLEDRDLAARDKAESSFALRCTANPAGPSRLLAKRAASRRVGLDRVAARGGGTDQILALHSPGRHETERSCPISQTALDHRAGLPGVKTRTRLRPF